jgi:hypothetical protein
MGICIVVWVASSKVGSEICSSDCGTLGDTHLYHVRLHRHRTHGGFNKISRGAND